MTRVYNKYDRVRQHIIEWREKYGEYPTTEEIARVFHVDIRSAQKFLRRFILELGE